jgi:hypothetical protein
MVSSEWRIANSKKPLPYSLFAIRHSLEAG